MNKPITEKEKRIGQRAMKFLLDQQVPEEDKENVFAGFCCGYEIAEKASEERMKPLLEALESILAGKKSDDWKTYSETIAFKALKQYRGEV